VSTDHDARTGGVDVDERGRGVLDSMRATPARSSEVSEQVADLMSSATKSP
jgi:hypothetical protein